MKAIKKALALCLALAMVVTAVPVSTADAAVKSAKLSKSSVTVAGNATKKQTKSVKVTTNADWKQVKVTASSADKKVATVKVSKKTVKVTAVKKGETKVTVNVTGKKSGKKVSKKLTLKVTVCGAGLAVKAPAELTVGDTAKLAVKTTPSTASCTFDVDKKEVATVSDNGTITAVAAGTAKVVVRTDYGKEKIVTVTVKEADSLTMTSLDAVKADTLVAKFASAVKTDNVNISLKRGTTAVENTATWDAEAKTLTVKTNAKMIKGTYELTVTAKDDATKTTSKTVVIEDQKVDKIVITNDVALTGRTDPDDPSTDAFRAYVYYDVLDQYGESMRSTTSIDWSTSVKIVLKNPATGKLTLERTDGKAFTYGEQIFVTGVNAKSGVSVTKTLTVGQKQEINSVKVAGFIKKNTTEILKALPEDFKSLEYYMVYSTLDQNGNALDAGKFTAGNKVEDITFASTAPLIISEMTTAGKVVTIDGVEYDTVLVKPGIKVEQGGEVTISAIANRTGNKDTIVVPVNVGTVIKSFEIGEPADIITDGSCIDPTNPDKYDYEHELPYTALDEKGNKVTHFETIAKQVTFNKLQFSVSEGNLKLVQKDDGSAKLVFIDKIVSWNDSAATDGQDRIVSLAAIVVGGDTNNQMLRIADKARPVGIKSAAFRSAYVEGDTTNLKIASSREYDDKDAWLTYVDQYGRPMKTALADDFFVQSGADAVAGTDFKGYVYGVAATSASTNVTKVNGTAAAKVLLNYKGGAANAKARLAFPTNINGAKSGEVIKLAVARVKTADIAEPDKWEKVDKDKSFDFSVVDIKKVQGITVGNIGKMYVNTTNSNEETLKNDDIATFEDDQKILTTGSGNPLYAEKLVVTGTYAGKNDVLIPAQYIWASGKYLKSSTAKAQFNRAAGWEDDNNYKYKYIDSVRNAIPANKLYNIVGASNAGDTYARKDAEDTIKINIREAYRNDATGDLLPSDGNGISTGDVVTTSVKTVSISDEAPDATSIVASVPKDVLNPTNTGLSNSRLLTRMNGWQKLFDIYDQYERYSYGMVYEIKDVKEANEYTIGNFIVSDNSSDTISVEGAEVGDVYTIVASKGKLSASVEITVGADTNSYIDKDGNAYLEILVARHLEQQRQDVLK